MEIIIMKELLEANDKLAKENRAYFAARHTIFTEWKPIRKPSGFPGS